MHKVAKHYGLPAREFTQSVLDACQNHSWPGNLKELENFVKRYLVAGDENLSLEGWESSPKDNGNRLRTEIELSGNTATTSTLKSMIQNVRWETERNAIAAALQKTGWNRKAAARLLGVSYRTILYKIEQYEMIAPESYLASLSESRLTAPGAGKGNGKASWSRAMISMQIELKRNSSRTNSRSLRAAGRFGLAILLFASAGLLAQAGSQQPPASVATPTATAQAQNVETGATKAHDDSFVIGNDDILAINVWKEPDVSRPAVPVRSDGKISLPLVGEVQAAGRTPLKLEQEIATKLKNYIAEPEVTVMVQQINSQKFNILGMVNRPGSYPISNSATVLDAIALAGGFKDFAKQKAIYVLRQNPDGTQARLAFNYKEVVKGKNPAQNIKLQPRDTIVVP